MSVTEQPKEIEMIELKNGGGLCMTCNNAPTCFYRASRGPGLFSEMFDDYVAPVARVNERIAVRSSGSSLGFQATEEETSRYKGLSEQDEHGREFLSALQDRARELDCLYAIERLLEDTSAAPNAVLHDVVRAIPTAWSCLTECCSGLVLSSPATATNGTRARCT